MLELLKLLAGILTAVAAILGAAITIKGEWPQVIEAVTSSGSTSIDHGRGEQPQSKDGGQTPKVHPALTGDASREIASVPCEMGPLLTKTNLSGNDINHGETASNAQECQTRCALDQKCSAMTYDTIAQQCWIKNVIPAASFNDHSISSKCASRQ